MIESQTAGSTSCLNNPERVWIQGDGLLCKLWLRSRAYSHQATASGVQDWASTACWMARQRGRKPDAWTGATNGGDP